MTDQLRPDYVGWHPRSVAAMPRVERVVGRGTVFRSAVTPNPICTPARVAVLTGKYPHQVGMLSMSGDLSLQHRTYPAALRQAGYRTAAIGKGHWFQTWPWSTPRGAGLDLAGMRRDLDLLGFETLLECSGKELLFRNRCDYAVWLENQGLLEEVRNHVSLCHGSTPLHGPGPAPSAFGGVRPWPFVPEAYYDSWIADRSIEWLKSNSKQEPWMLFASFVSPHPPFDPPASWMDAVKDEEVDDLFRGNVDVPEAERAKAMAYRKAYLANIRLLDHEMGRVLDALQVSGHADNTVIIFCSDHGEFLGDWNRMNKSRPEWVSSEVPMAIYDPRNHKSQTVDSVVGLIDLTATILDFAGLGTQESLSRSWPAFHDRIPSRSLRPIVHGESRLVRDHAFSACQGEWSMIRSEAFRFIRWTGPSAPPVREQLFDLQSDPDHSNNLADDLRYGDALSQHREMLLRIWEDTPPAQLTWAENHLMSPMR